MLYLFNKFDILPDSKTLLSMLAMSKREIAARDKHVLVKVLSAKSGICVK